MTASLTLNLKPNELDYIASLLARQPWQEVNPLLSVIQQQVQQQQQPQIQPEVQRQRGNGFDASGALADSPRN